VSVLLAVAYALVYTVVGVGLLALGFWVLDLLTPGHLPTQVWRDAAPGAAVVSAAGALSVGLIAFTSIWVNAASGFGTALLATVVFGVLGVALQALGLVALDRLLPHRLGDVVIARERGDGRRLHPGVFVIAAWQLSVAGVVIASTA
jgi:hypothetical protein